MVAPLTLKFAEFGVRRNYTVVFVLALANCEIEDYKCRQIVSEARTSKLSSSMLFYELRTNSSVFWDVV